MRRAIIRDGLAFCLLGVAVLGSGEVVLAQPAAAPAASAPATTCKHTACSCAPMAGDVVCSEACRKAVEAGGSAPCTCGAGGCKAPK